MRACRVLSCERRARSTFEWSSLVNRLFRATSSVYRPLFFALPQSNALFALTSPAVTPYEKPRAAWAAGATASRRMVRASGVRRCMRMEPGILWKVAGAPVGCRADGDLPDGHARGREPGSAARALQRVRLRSAASRGRRAGGRRLGRRPPARHRRAGRLPRCDRAFRAGRTNRADPPNARPPRQPDRRGGARPVVALVPPAGDRTRGARAAVAGPAAGWPRRARGPLLRVEPGEFWRDVPGLDDLFGHSGAARGA